MADNIFTKQLSSARGSAADVGVARDAGAKYRANANLIQSVGSVASTVTNKLVGDYQVSQANEEINEALNDLNTTQSKEGQEALDGARDELELTALKQEQGIISQRQRDQRINDIINKRIAQHPSQKERLTALKNSYGVGQSQTAKKISAQSAREQAQAEALKTQLTAREKTSMQMFGKPSSELTDKQFNALKDWEGAQQSVEVEKVRAELSKYQYQQLDYADKSRDIVIDRDAENVVAKINSSMLSGFTANSLSLSQDTELTQDEYNRARLNINNLATTARNEVVALYAKYGKVPPQAILNNIATQTQDQLKYLETYNNFTVEEKRKISFEAAKLEMEVEELGYKQQGLVIKNLNDRTNLYNNDLMITIRGATGADINAVAKPNAELLMPGSTAFYTDKDGNFDNQKWMNDLSVSISNVGMNNITNAFGEQKGMTIMRGIATTPNIGMPNNATNTLTSVGSNEPQTDAIKEVSLNNKQKAETIIEQAGNLTDKAMKYINSSLSYLTSNSFQVGSPNTEISMYKGEATVEQIGDALSYAQQWMSENPNEVFIEEDNIKTSNAEVNRILAQSTILQEKFKNVPNVNKAIQNRLIKVREDAITETIIKPIDNTIDQVLSSPIYNGLSPAQKQDIKEEVRNNSLEIKQAIGLQKRQATKTQELANKIKGISVNNTTLRTITNNFLPSASPSSIAQAGIDTATATAQVAQGDITGAATTIATSPATTGLLYVGLQGDALINNISATVKEIYQNTFGKDPEERTMEAVDKRYGISASRAKVLRQIENKTMPEARAFRSYDQLVPIVEQLEDKQMLTGITSEEDDLLTYYQKTINLIEKKYKPEDRVPADAVERSLSEPSINLSEGAQQITEELIEDTTPIEVSQEEAVQEQLDEGVDINEIRDDIL